MINVYYFWFSLTLLFKYIATQELRMNNATDNISIEMESLLKEHKLKEIGRSIKAKIGFNSSEIKSDKKMDFYMTNFNSEYGLDSHHVSGLFKDDSMIARENYLIQYGYFFISN